MKKKQKRIKITVNFNNMMSKNIGPAGISDADVNRLKPKIKQAVTNLKQKREDGKLGFVYLPYDSKTKEEVKKAAEHVRERFDNLVVLGIGGSALGTIAAHRAIKHPFYNMLPADRRKGPRLFVMDNADPEAACALFDVIDLKKTAVNIISKSGETAETTAFMKIIWQRLKKAVGEKFREHIIVTTDRANGVMRKVADENRLCSFGVPDNVGGRFSIFTPVGLFPLACCGVNIDELLRGAAFMDNMTSRSNVWKNPAYLRAVLHFISDRKFKRNITVMMPYSNALEDMAGWFAQIWGESLGKKLDNSGRTINVGLTPVKALGATDQHSQVQLYVEGPDDKVTTFIRAEKFRHDIEMPKNFNDYEPLSYLSGERMGKLLNAEQRATEAAFVNAKRPSMTVTMPEISEFTLGQLLYMLQVETAFMGELYGINAFDQPGVEAGKIMACAIMGRKKYKDRLKGFRTPKDRSKYII